MTKAPQTSAASPTATPAKRSETEGLFHFGKEMISALGMALVFIIYVVQAFKIPTGSMEDSLLVGDFLLGLKFIYGAPLLPFSYAKLPGILKPKPGDVIIFEYPGIDNKDYIKRCVAGPGQTLSVHGKNLIIDGVTLKLPPDGKYVRGGQLDPGIADFAPLRIPAQGDTLIPADLPLRELVFARNLIVQENPRSRIAKFFETLPVIGPPATVYAGKEHVQLSLELAANGVSLADRMVTVQEEQLVPVHVTSRRDFEVKKKQVLKKLSQLYANSPHMSIAKWVPIRGGIGVLAVYRGPVGEFPFGVVDNWKRMENVVEQMTAQVGCDSCTVDIRKHLVLNGKEIDKYVVKNDNFFMMGDNRDNSLDSRYWGYLNQNYVKAKAFILYFSLKKDVPLVLLPLKIRWDRIGKLIRSWDGKPASAKLAGA